MWDESTYSIFVPISLQPTTKQRRLRLLPLPPTLHCWDIHFSFTLSVTINTYTEKTILVWSCSRSLYSGDLLINFTIDHFAQMHSIDMWYCWNHQRSIDGQGFVFDQPSSSHSQNFTHALVLGSTLIELSLPFIMSASHHRTMSHDHRC